VRVECADVINARRESIGMTIRALARKVGMDDDTLGKTLKGKRRMTATELLLISRELGLGFEDYISPEREAV